MNKETQKLVQLINENPELPVIPFVSYDVVGDDYGMWMGSFADCRVVEYAIFDDRYYTDINDVKDAYYNYHEDELKGLKEEEIENILNEKIKDIWKRAIIVDIA